MLFSGKIVTTCITKHLLSLYYFLLFIHSIHLIAHEDYISLDLEWIRITRNFAWQYRCVIVHLLDITKLIIKWSLVSFDVRRYSMKCWQYKMIKHLQQLNLYFLLYYLDCTCQMIKNMNELHRNIRICVLICHHITYFLNTGTPCNTVEILCTE